MSETRHEPPLRSLLDRYVTIAGAGAGVIGAIVGLIIGFNVNPGTAPFAALEIGIPACFAGVLVGCMAALTSWAAHRIRR